MTLRCAPFTRQATTPRPTQRSPWARTESARLAPKVGTLARLAECDEKLGHIVAARNHWQEALNLGRALRDDRTKHVEDELARLDKVVPKVNVTLEGAPPDGFALRVDETQVGAASLGVPLPVDPGRHAIEASALGKARWSTTVETRADGGVIAITIPALADAAPHAAVAKPPSVTPRQVPPAPAILAPATPERASPLRAIGLVSAGVGVVGLGVGTAFAFVAKSKFNDSTSGGCDANNVCPGGSYQTRLDARAAGNLATAFFVAGGLLAAGGVTLWLLAPRETSSAARVRVAPSIGANDASVRVLGVW